jgi:hypothetical protein
VKLRLTRKIDVFLIALLGLAVFFLILKSLRLGHFSQWMDEGFFYLAAHQIRDVGYPLYPSGYVLYKCIFFSYLLSFISLVAGFSTESLRFLSVLLHALTPVILYLSLRRILRREVLFAAGVLLYFSLWQTEYARLILYYVPVQLLILWGLILFYQNRVLERRNLYGLAWGAALLTHQLAVGLIFAFAGLLAVNARRFFSKKNLLALLLWAPIFIFIQVQEILLWKVGQVYSTQNISSLKDALNYFFQGFSLTYFKILRKSFPSFSALFLAGSLVFVLTLAFKKIRKKEWSKAETFALFLLVTFSLTVFSLGFMRTHPMPRYLFPFIAQMFLLNVFYLYEGSFFLVHKAFKKPRPAAATALVVTLLFPFLFVSDIGWPKVISVVQREYVDEVQSDVITSSGRHYQEDQQTVGQFVRMNLRPGDVVLAMHMVFQYIYAGKVDGWLFSGGPGTWDAGEFVNGKWRDFYLGVPWIRSAEALQDLIGRSLEKNKRVWVIGSPSEERLDHINRGLRDFLLDNRNRVLWVGKDGVSRVYLFDRLDRKSRFYEAEWGIPVEGRVVNRQNLSPESFVEFKGRYLTANIFFRPGRHRLSFHFRDSDGQKVLIRLHYGRRVVSQTTETIQQGTAAGIFKIRKGSFYYFEIQTLGGSSVRFDFIQNEQE